MNRQKKINVQKLIEKTKDNYKKEQQSLIKTLEEEEDKLVDYYIERLDSIIEKIIKREDLENSQNLIRSINIKVFNIPKKKAINIITDFFQTEKIIHKIKNHLTQDDFISIDIIKKDIQAQNNSNIIEITIHLKTTLVY